MPNTYVWGNCDMKSVWSDTVKIPARESLKGNKKADVAVIGGGMAGLLIAYYLQKQGKRVIVLEANRIAGGQTKNTTAKITSQHGVMYSKLEQQLGEKYAKAYASACQEAIDAFEHLIREEEINCHFERVHSYLYSLHDKDELMKELVSARRAGLPVSFREKLPLPFRTEGAVCFENQAQFHPLEFVKAISEKLIIYEHTKVLTVKGHHVNTEHGTVHAEHVVFATQYPFLRSPGFYFLRQHQERSYVMAIEGVEKWEGMYYGTERGDLSFRWYENILLVGGGGHRTGELKGICGYTALEAQISSLFGSYREVARWSAQDCMPHDDLYFIGRYSMYLPNWYVATGFKKWGMTGAMLSAQIITDLICGRENPYAKIFAPKRLHRRVARPNLRHDLCVSTVSVGKGYFHWPIRSTQYPAKGEARIIRRGIKRLGVYRDEKGKLHTVSVKCPHLGCELAWNSEEKTWDCPCHGSRFHYDGKLIDGPAQKEIGVTQ